MIIPKKHTQRLGDVSADAGDEFLHLIGKYEDAGYNFYARAPQSGMKTIPHQHTHLLKPHGRARRFVLYLRRPYTRWHF